MRVGAGAHSPLKTSKAIKNNWNGFDTKFDNDVIFNTRDLPDDVNSSIKVT